MIHTDYHFCPCIVSFVCYWVARAWALAYCFPQAIAAVEPQGITVNVVTRFLIMTPPAHVAPLPGTQAQRIFTINALKYTSTLSDYMHVFDS
ncbi:MAG: hypothetical protein KDJ31_17295 [Candidatus Competibacteraceae bacterium]|nr:hypothetical protein [Candidatus Competibacteraceae bacterium]MCB1820481.1 hypothetical protein [Candidatus Competibacteraceae bacterium]HRY14746.1 hypothetical protein [Candidatus Competibacteraceae bacterium]